MGVYKVLYYWHIVCSEYMCMCMCMWDCVGWFKTRSPTALRLVRNYIKAFDTAQLVHAMFSIALIRACQNTASHYTSTHINTDHRTSTQSLHPNRITRNYLRNHCKS